MTKNGKFLLISAALAVALLLRYGFGLITPFLLGAALAFLQSPLPNDWKREGNSPEREQRTFPWGSACL